MRALFDVGLHEQLAVELKKTSDVVEESIPNDEPLLVPLFPPRIREMDEHCAERPVGPEAREGLTSVLCKDTCTIAESSARETPVHDGGPFPANLETQQPGAGLGFGSLDHEPAAPRADLGLDPLAPDE